LSGVGKVTGFLSRLTERRGAAEDPSLVAPGAEPEPVVSTKALRKFVAALRQCPSPTLLDLGPVLGANIQYFGEQLGCKVIVEDVFEDLDRLDRENRASDLPAFLDSRFPLPPESVDGILCWDLFDFLDRASAQVAAAHMMRVLKPDGALFGMFATGHPVEARFTKFIVVDDDALRHRAYSRPRMRQAVIQNRDIGQLFGQLRVSDLFLLKSKVREILFRKPVYLSNR
jgi:SAM-dependent methyltransferase